MTDDRSFAHRLTERLGDALAWLATRVQRVAESFRVASIPRSEWVASYRASMHLAREAYQSGHYGRAEQYARQAVELAEAARLLRPMGERGGWVRRERWARVCQDVVLGTYETVVPFERGGDLAREETSQND